jgi:hypothetical protein
MPVRAESEAGEIRAEAAVPEQVKTRLVEFDIVRIDKKKRQFDFLGSHSFQTAAGKVGA